MLGATVEQLNRQSLDYETGIVFEKSWWSYVQAGDDSSYKIYANQKSEEVQHLQNSKNVRIDIERKK